MNIRNLCLSALIAFSAVANGQAKELNVYQQELKDFKHSDHELIFDEDANESLRAIQTDIENFKELTFFQRLLRFAILSSDSIVVTSKTMPKLYGYVEGICKQHNIPVPTVCISTEKGILNAFAMKLFTSTGGIWISQKMIKETSADELEAIVAHEIGHIKHNHVNKLMLLKLTTYIPASILVGYLIKNKPGQNEIVQGLYKFWLASTIADIATSCIINKAYEKQADEFAYKSMNKGKGIVEFFENILDKEKQRDTDFDNTYDLLQDGKSQFSTRDYVVLMMRYYSAKVGHLFNKAHKWVYYNTPYGAHPRPEARIKAAQDYLDQHSDLQAIAS